MKGKAVDQEALLKAAQSSGAIHKAYQQLLASEQDPARLSNLIAAYRSNDPDGLVPAASQRLKILEAANAQKEAQSSAEYYQIKQAQQLQEALAQNSLAPGDICWVTPIVKEVSMRGGLMKVLVIEVKPPLVLAQFDGSTDVNITVTGMSGTQWIQSRTVKRCDDK